MPRGPKGEKRPADAIGMATMQPDEIQRGVLARDARRFLPDFFLAFSFLAFSTSA